jgi:flagellin-specific chaperone FliS
MLKKEILKKELVANAMKGTVKIDVRHEWDEGVDIHFQDTRFNFLNKFAEKYHDHVYNDDLVWDLLEVKRKHCEMVVDKLGFTGKTNQIKINNKSIDFDMKFAEIDNNPTDDTIAICMIAGDNEMHAIEDLVAKTIDVQELTKLYIAHTDELINSLVKFLHTDQVFISDDIHTIYTYMCEELPYEDEDVVYMTVESEVNEIVDIAYKGLNKLQKRCGLPVINNPWAVA